MPQTQKPTACLALADGTVFYGQGFGAVGQTEAELCFNTAMSGYQEIMTDPSYAGQIVTFTFPHIGNVGVNPDDDETGDPVAAGMVVKWMPTTASNWRAVQELSEWLAARGRVAIGGIDTRRLTRAIRQSGAPTWRWRTIPRATSTSRSWSRRHAPSPASPVSTLPAT
ncbi:carbamoyl-phosphate synthase, small subunit [Salipiger profundus]|uniref:carbamoyl-phosphate synthase (glutamine-hydrolyzing) n=1 Tax=Salipiger profundus TaxID=1229727 RepID=A0A1U7D6T1_9RHOB|nr:carbamoyl-phosphate synthase, small subunit [Salipiger profundus]